MSKPRYAVSIADLQSSDMERLSAVSRDDTVSVREFLLFLWRSRWFALIGAAFCTLSAAAASWIVTPKFTASVVLLPVSGHGGSFGALGSAASQLGGLASLTGLNLGGTNSAKEEALATLQSRILTEKYIEQNDLLPILFAKQWNPATRNWRSASPTLWQGNRLFESIRGVDDNAKTGMVTVTIRWTSPSLAATWANGLVRLTNDYLREKAINRAERNLAYLNSEVSKVGVMEVKNEIYRLMEQEIKNEMLAKGRRDFALKVIDPAVPPETKSFPRPLLWMVGGALGGLFLGLLASVTRETLVDEQTERQKRNAQALSVRTEEAARKSESEGI